MSRIIRSEDYLMAPDAAAMERRKDEKIKKAIEKIRRRRNLKKKEKRMNRAKRRRNKK